MLGVNGKKTWVSFKIRKESMRHCQLFEMCQCKRNQQFP